MSHVIHGGALFPFLIISVSRMHRRHRNRHDSYREPGSLCENGYVESINGKLRNEVLNREVSIPCCKPKYLWIAGDGNILT